jgi:hypothetical protein
MILAPFELHRPETLDEALALPTSSPAGPTCSRTTRTASTPSRT